MSAERLAQPCVSCDAPPFGPYCSQCGERTLEPEDVLVELVRAPQPHGAGQPGPVRRCARPYVVRFEPVDDLRLVWLEWAESSPIELMASPAVR